MEGLSSGWTIVHPWGMVPGSVLEQMKCVTTTRSKDDQFNSPYFSEERIDHALKAILFDKLKIHIRLFPGVHLEPGSVARGRPRWRWKGRRQLLYMWNRRRIVIANRPRSVPVRNVIERRGVELLLGLGTVRRVRGHCELGPLISLIPTF